MKALTRRQGVGVLLGICLMVALLVGGAHLLRPAPGPLLGEVPRPPVTSCANGLRQDPIDVRSGTLLGCPERFDGRRVRLQGEPIGDLLGRGRGRWVLFNDDDYAFAGPLVAHHQTLGTNGGIAVLLGEGMLPTALGGPDMWGDLLEVTGTFHAAAEQDQGGPAVIATSVEVLRAGSPVEPVPATAQRIVAPLMVVLAAGLGAVAWRKGR